MSDAQEIGCCCESQPWYGKMPTRAVPLTDVAIRGWIRGGCLTPPSGSVPRGERIGRILWGAFGLLLIASLGVAFTYPLWSK